MFLVPAPPPPPSRGNNVYGVMDCTWAPPMFGAVNYTKLQGA